MGSRFLCLVTVLYCCLAWGTARELHGRPDTPPPLSYDEEDYNYDKDYSDKVSEFFTKMDEWLKSKKTGNVQEISEFFEKLDEWWKSEKTGNVQEVSELLNKLDELLQSEETGNVQKYDNGCPNVMCGPEYNPVCGSDGRDYFNKCDLANTARCFDSSVTLKHYGGCEASKGRSLVSDTPCNWPQGQQYWPHPTNCLMYVQCSPSGPVERPCPAGTAWSQSLLTCDHLYNTDCDPYKPQGSDDKDPCYHWCKRPSGESYCCERAIRDI